MDQLLISRLILIAAALAVGAAAYVRREQTKRLITNFFTATTHPINLAVFRIVLFATIARLAMVGQPEWFAALPAELIFPPSKLKWLPITLELTHLCLIGLYVSCFFAIVGFKTRFSALMATVFALYVLVVPKFFGKVDHHHHLIWFSTLLVFSPCGDALSIDRWLATRKATDTRPLVPGMQYALPLRFVWLLLGIIYFFSGWAKIWLCGFKWIFSDNLALTMRVNWLLRDFMPFFRIDLFPFLCQTMALASVLFEISFIFLIFFDRVRIWAAAEALLFHNMSGLFMFHDISFWHLQTSYVSFLDWNRLFNRSARESPAPSATELPQAKTMSLKPLIVIGTLICLAVSVASIRQFTSWPLSMYPTFAWIEKPTMPMVEFDVYRRDGTLLKGEKPWRCAELTPIQWQSLSMKVALGKDPEKRQKQILALWSVVRRCNPELAEAGRVAYVLKNYSTQPVWSAKPEQSTPPASDTSATTTNTVEDGTTDDGKGTSPPQDLFNWSWTQSAQNYTYRVESAKTIWSFQAP